MVSPTELQKYYIAGIIGAFIGYSFASSKRLSMYRDAFKLWVFIVFPIMIILSYYIRLR